MDPLVNMYNSIVSWILYLWRGSSTIPSPPSVVSPPPTDTDIPHRPQDTNRSPLQQPPVERERSRSPLRRSPSPSLSPPEAYLPPTATDISTKIPHRPQDRSRSPLPQHRAERELSRLPLRHSPSLPRTTTYIPHRPQDRNRSPLQQLHAGRERSRSPLRCSTSPSLSPPTVVSHPPTGTDIPHRPPQDRSRSKRQQSTAECQRSRSPLRRRSPSPFLSHQPVVPPPPTATHNPHTPQDRSWSLQQRLAEREWSRPPLRCSPFPSPSLLPLPSPPPTTTYIPHRLQDVPTAATVTSASQLFTPSQPALDPWQHFPDKPGLEWSNNNCYIAAVLTVIREASWFDAERTEGVDLLDHVRALFDANCVWQLSKDLKDTKQERFAKEGIDTAMSVLLTYMEWDDLLPQDIGTGHANDPAEFYQRFVEKWSAGFGRPLVGDLKYTVKYTLFGEEEEQPHCVMNVMITNSGSVTEAMTQALSDQCPDIHTLAPNSMLLDVPMTLALRIQRLHAWIRVDVPLEICRRNYPELREGPLFLFGAVLSDPNHFTSIVKTEHGWRHYDGGRCSRKSDREAMCLIAEKCYLLFFERRPTVDERRPTVDERRPTVDEQWEDKRAGRSEKAESAPESHNAYYKCNTCNRTCGSRIGLISHSRRCNATGH